MLWDFVELGLHHSLYFLVHGSEMTHNLHKVGYDHGFQGRALQKKPKKISLKGSEYLSIIHKVSNYIGPKFYVYRREKSKLIFAGNKFVSPDSGPDKI